MSVIFQLNIFFNSGLCDPKVHDLIELLLKAYMCDNYLCYDVVVMEKTPHAC